MEGQTLTYAVIVLMTIAIINRIKQEAPAIKPYWYTIISIAVAAGLYAISLYAPAVVQGFIFIGAAASGVYDIASVVSARTNETPLPTIEIK
jgi:hypothetical protein